MAENDKPDTTPETKAEDSLSLMKRSVEAAFNTLDAFNKSKKIEILTETAKRIVAVSAATGILFTGILLLSTYLFPHWDALIYILAGLQPVILGRPTRRPLNHAIAQKVILYSPLAILLWATALVFSITLLPSPITPSGCLPVIAFFLATWAWFFLFATQLVYYILRLQVIHLYTGLPTLICNLGKTLALITLNVNSDGITPEQRKHSLISLKEVEEHFADSAAIAKVLDDSYSKFFPFDSVAKK